MKDWHNLKPELFKKQPYYLPGCDSYPTAEQKVAITAGQTAARYSTRSAYIIDNVLQEPSADLSRIAAQIGRLGLLVNEFLAEDESHNRRLTGRRADKAVRKIIEACDAITNELQDD